MRDLPSEFHNRRHSSTATENSASTGNTQNDGAKTDDLQLIYGYSLIVIAFLVFFVFMYACIFSKLLPETNHVLLDYIREDYYYTILLPTLIPTSVLWVYSNWVSLKFFRHN
mmetsp:Transcript_58808/g.67016  ORF Transcript_58808/g.67016 Transcript_58808/m.67016 type:complete len:112 (+) Transcript_58808:48-383(+)